MLNHASRFQADSLERDALEILALTRSLKNSLVPANRIPSEVLLLLPDCCDESYADKFLIDSTHVCRSWREIFISRSSLWTNLNFMDVEKTRTYIQRSRSSSLNISLQNTDDITYLDDAFSLVIPHISRLQSLAIHGDVSPDVLSYFCCPAPRLEKLDICITPPDLEFPIFDGSSFNGELPSLREFSLSGVVTDLGWRNMKNLTAFTLSNPEAYDVHEVTVTQILDFFESAPSLRHVEIKNPIPDSSDAPLWRIVSLPHLKTFSLSTFTSPSILLNHFHIPPGASLMAWDSVKSEEFSPLDYLPDKSPNFENLSHIDVVNLYFKPGVKSVLLGGPSGILFLVCYMKDHQTVSSVTVGHRILRSIGPPRLPTIRKIEVSKYAHPPQARVEGCPVFQALSSINTLRTLILSDCNPLPFILALNPEKNSSALVPCPNLEELVIYPSLDPRHEYAGDLVDMSRSRDSKGAKLSSITIVDDSALEEEVSKLKEHATHVEHRRESYTMESPWNSRPDE